MVMQSGRDTVKKLDLLSQINNAKKAAGHVKGVGDRAANKVLGLSSEEKSDGRKSQ
jgi:hypothetical protein